MGLDAGAEPVMYTQENDMTMTMKLNGEWEELVSATEFLELKKEVEDLKARLKKLEDLELYRVMGAKIRQPFSREGCWD